MKRLTKMKKLKFISVVGARPNFMKIAPFLHELKKHPQITSLLVHTGQHYDFNMSDVFFQQLQINDPDYHLGIGSASHAEQTAKIMVEFEKVLQKESPDLVIVVGDVNSTIACALVAVKLGIKVAHIEAGLRSFDRTMPEEINRILTDQISDFLLVTEQSGITNLKKENIAEAKTFFVGNLMIDSLINFKKVAQQSNVLQTYHLKEKEYIAVTLHRPSTVDDKEAFTAILDAFSQIQKKIKIILPLHPRSVVRLEQFNLKAKVDAMHNLVITQPLSYFDFLALMMHAKAVITDSGGIQEETTYLGIPCITTRNNTERPSTIDLGTNILVGLDKNKLVTESFNILDGKIKAGSIPPLWDGKTAERIVEILINSINTNN